MGIPLAAGVTLENKPERAMHKPVAPPMDFSMHKKAPPVLSSEAINDLQQYELL
jgi:hypothetical protein